MSASPPPTPDAERWAAEYASSNGASANALSASPIRLVVLGYITAFTLPPIGFILGVVVGLRTRGTASKHWIWIILLSIIGGIIWTLVFVSGGLSSTSNDLS